MRKNAVAGVMLALSLGVGGAISLPLAALADDPTAVIEEVASSPDMQTPVSPLTEPTQVEPVSVGNSMSSEEPATLTTDVPVAPSLPIEQPLTEVTPAVVPDSPQVARVAEVAPTVAPATTPTATKTLKWILPNGGTASNVTWDQPVYNPKNVALLPCSTEFTVQVDDYPYGTKAEKARTDALDDDGYLRYGEDHGWVIDGSWRFETYTSPTCPKVPLDAPVFTPGAPTCDLPGNFGDIDLTAPTGADNGYNQYKLGARVFFKPAPTGPGEYDITIQGVGAGAVGYEATYPYGTKITQTTQHITVLPAIGYQNTDSEAPCYIEPKPPLTTTGDWIDSEYDCDDTEVTQNRTLTATPFLFDSITGLYTPDATITTTQTQTRPLTADEIKALDCPTEVPPTEEPPTEEQPPASIPPAATPPTTQLIDTPAPAPAAVPVADKLAYTGIEIGTTVGAIAILLLAGIILTSLARRKKTEN